MHEAWRAHTNTVVQTLRARASTMPEELARELASGVGRLIATGPETSIESAASRYGETQGRNGAEVGVLISEYTEAQVVLLETLSELSIDVPPARVARLISDALVKSISAHLRGARSVVDPDGSSRRIEELSRDVMARKADLRLVMDALPFLVAFVDVDERYGLVSKAYETWFGVPAEQLVGSTVLSLIGQEAYAALEPYLRRGLAGESFSFEKYGVPYRLGGTRDVYVTFIPQVLGGVFAGYVVVLEDITKRRQLQDDNARLARHSIEVLETMGDSFFALDAEWRITQVNQRFECAVGSERAELIGKSFLDTFPEAAAPESVYVENYRRCMQNRVAVHFEHHSERSERWFDVRGFPRSDGGISVFIRDISVEHDARLELKQRSHFEQQLIGIVSHDLRNPLNVISLACAASLEMDGLHPIVAKNLARVVNASDRATRLVRDLLDFTQARLGGGIRITPAPMNAHVMIEEVVEELKATFPDRLIEVVRGGDGEVTWDRDRLAQVVENLTTNALKYSPVDSPVRVVSTGLRDAVLVTVHNGGVAIPAEKLSNLFEPYERAVTKMESTSRSVGLGLYIVRSIVQSHRGSVEVTSSAEKGTTFSVRLPRKSIANTHRATPIVS